MKVNEDLSILFWLKRQKATKEGLVPIYVRITVKGGRTEFSSGKKVHPDYWDEESATALSGCLGIPRRVTMSFRGKRSMYLAGGRVQQMLF